ncbi:MAG: DUF1254 domain-containing protein [Beijerinckiaceae bacterium]|nr:DUF1254 domain-containing protein [Beijerinckiaceae bacterium]
MSMKDRDLLMDWLPVVLGALVLAGVVHILSVLAVPYLSSQDTWSRLARMGEPNRFTIMARGAAGESALPFEDPRTFVAACHYDLAAGPVRVQADFSGDGMVIFSFHERRGATFYGLNDRGGLRGKLDALIVTGAQLQAIEAETPDDEQVQELRLMSPSRNGYVLARSVIVDTADVEGARRRLASLTCAQQQAPR